MRHSGIVLLLLLGLVAPPAIAGEPPVGLIMAVSGSTTPPLTAMSEIPSGAAVQLSPDAELTILDYARCKMVTVAGGTVTVTRFEFLADGKILSEVDAPCPRIHQLSAAATGPVAGGLVMRGVASVPRWPLNREFVLSGDGAADLKTAAIYAEGRMQTPLVRLDVSGHRARIPAESAPLPAGERYVLRLTMANGANPVDISFIGAVPSGTSLVVVLRSR